MCNQCCIKKITSQLTHIIEQNDQIICNTSNSNYGILCSLLEAVENIEGMLSHDLPMTVAAEYPTEYEDRVVYTTDVVLMDLLNPNPFIIFKGVINVALPVYLKDGNNYEHIVSINVQADQALANELTNNISYPSVYEGNYVTLTV